MRHLLASVSGPLFLCATLAACASGGAHTPPDSANDLGPGFSLAEGDRVVPVPGVGRPYWTVVRASGGHHYLLPRPDGADALARECSADSRFGHELQEHALCKPAESEEAVAKVNALSEWLAFEVSTTLHRELHFTRVGDSIAPAPLARDLLEICRTDATLREGAMKARCADEEKYADGGPRPAIFMVWSDAELDAVPKALDALYGVAAP